MITKLGRNLLDRGRKSLCEMRSMAKVRVSERAHAVCNLERGVKIAVGDSDGRTDERAANGRWGINRGGDIMSGL